MVNELDLVTVTHEENVEVERKGSEVDQVMGPHMGRGMRAKKQPKHLEQFLRG